VEGLLSLAKHDDLNLIVLIPGDESLLPALTTIFIHYFFLIWKVVAYNNSFASLPILRVLAVI
jgi:hypothetical protein